MDRMTEIKVQGMERRAALLERHAAEREARTPRLSRLGERTYFAALEKTDQDRNEARKLRLEASRLRRASA